MFNPIAWQTTKATASASVSRTVLVEVFSSRWCSALASEGTHATLVHAHADPYLVPSGPTAHPLPLNTFLVALLYKTFGFTLAAGYARCLLHVTIYCTMYALMPWLGERLGLGRRAGLIGGLAGAMIPYQGSEEVVGWTSNEPLTAIALGLLLVALVRRWKAGHTTSANSLCIGLGFTAITRAAPISSARSKIRDEQYAL